MSDTVTCDLCAREIARHTSFIVRIDVFADPTVPPTEGEGIDSAQTIAEVLEQIKNMSADDLQDGVHRRFEQRLCAACQREFLVNPLGKPRGMRPGAGKN